MDKYTQDIAEAMGIPLDLLPYLPDLYRDLWSLGSSPATIVDLLRPYTLRSPSLNVLEPCCGKGAVSITLAKELGLTVHGIDIFPPFIREAQEKAERAGLEDHCRFQVGDVREIIPALSDFNIVIFAAVGGVFGDLIATIEVLRKVVQPGGYIVLDDGFLKDSARSCRPEWEHYRGHEETIRQLTLRGDSLLHEVVIGEEELKSSNRKIVDSIRIRVNELSGQHPELAGPLADLLAWVVEECKALERQTMWAVWLLKRV